MLPLDLHFSAARKARDVHLHDAPLACKSMELKKDCYVTGIAGFGQLCLTSCWYSKAGRLNVNPRGFPSVTAEIVSPGIVFLHRVQQHPARQCLQVRAAHEAAGHAGSGRRSAMRASLSAMPVPISAYSATSLTRSRTGLMGVRERGRAWRGSSKP